MHRGLPERRVSGNPPGMFFLRYLIPVLSAFVLMSGLSAAEGNAVVSEVAAPVPAIDARRFLFAATPPEFSSEAYADSVERLLGGFEQRTGQILRPGEKGKVALKLYTNSGLGMETPKDLTRAVIAALTRRGFKRENILLADLQERRLRETGYLPRLPQEGENFEGCPVLAWDTGRYFHARWYYENPLPSKDWMAQTGIFDTTAALRDRLSYLPMPLIMDVDFWINLPVAMDSPALGVSGALGNATIWNISNQRRFLDSPSNAEKAAVEVASIPELKKTFLFSILSLQRYQYIGGPRFDANYCLSEPQIWLSANPLIMDFLMLQRMNSAREKKGFPLIDPEPPMFVSGNAPPFSLGSCILSQITIMNVTPSSAAAGERAKEN